jgi:hypothetical protein
MLNLNIELRGLSAFDVEGKIGEGTFCVVFKGTERDTGAPVALKKIVIDPKVKSYNGFPVTVSRFVSNKCRKFIFRLKIDIP